MTNDKGVTGVIDGVERTVFFFDGWREIDSLEIKITHGLTSILVGRICQRGPTSSNKHTDHGESQSQIQAPEIAHQGPVVWSIQCFLLWRQWLLMIPWMVQKSGKLTSWGWWLKSYYLQGFMHPRWCRISTINSSIGDLKGSPVFQFWVRNGG